MRPLKILAGSWLAVCAACAAVAQEQLPSAGTSAATSHRVLIMLRESPGGARTLVQSAGGNPMQALATRTTFKLKQSRSISSALHAIEVQPQAAGETLEQTLARLRADPSVLS